jgi:hypothetical protein
MPRINEIRYRTNVNKGNYESEHVELVIELDPDDNPQETLVRARNWCSGQLGKRKLDEDELRRAAAVVF